MDLKLKGVFNAARAASEPRIARNRRSDEQTQVCWFNGYISCGACSFSQLRIGTVPRDSWTIPSAWKYFSIRVTTSFFFSMALFWIPVNFSD